MHLDTMLSPSTMLQSISDEDATLIEERGIMTIDAAMIEFISLYPKTEPYETIPTLTGPCYAWSTEFIDKCLLAMSVDRTIQFSSDEQEAWNFFVNFENYHSHSARLNDANGTAIGCTNPDNMNKSYVVAGNYLPNDGLDGRPLELCQPPGYEVESEQIWKSLDKVFMDLYNCNEIDNCNRDDTYEDISPCPITI